MQQADLKVLQDGGRGREGGGEVERGVGFSRNVLDLRYFMGEGRVGGEAEEGIGSNVC